MQHSRMIITHPQLLCLIGLFAKLLLQSLRRISGELRALVLPSEPSGTEGSGLIAAAFAESAPDKPVKARFFLEGAASNSDQIRSLGVG